MRVKVLAAALALGALVAGPGARAADPPNFDFYGYAQVSDVIASSLVVRTVLTNNGVVPTPILLDFTTKQYTLVLTGTLNGIVGIARNYNAATCAIYEDPIGSGTAANYATPSTFTDGTLILSGNFDGFLVRNRFSATLGNFIGKVNFNAGTRLGDLSTPLGWPCGGGWSRTVSGIPTGYQENWDGKIDLAAVGVENKSWDGVKLLYR
jgi:hypothetical protein